MRLGLSTFVVGISLGTETERIINHRGRDLTRLTTNDEYQSSFLFPIYFLPYFVVAISNGKNNPGPFHKTFYFIMMVIMLYIN